MAVALKRTKTKVPTPAPAPLPTEGLSARPTSANEALVKRDPTGRWLPGTVGGPGRPSVDLEFQRRAQALMEMPDGGWDTLCKLLRGEPADVRFAVELAAAYAYGKPSQRVQVTGMVGMCRADELLREFSTDELRRLLAIVEAGGQKAIDGEGKVV